MTRGGGWSSSLPFTLPSPMSIPITRPCACSLHVIAVGETVILMTPPFLSLLKHLLKVEGGCGRMTVSPTARPLRQSGRNVQGHPRRRGGPGRRRRANRPDLVRARGPVRLAAGVLSFC